MNEVRKEDKRRTANFVNDACCASPLVPRNRTLQDISLCGDVCVVLLYTSRESAMAEQSKTRDCPACIKHSEPMEWDACDDSRFSAAHDP